MTADRAALVEKVARAISNPDGSEDNWKFWTGEAEIAISLIRAEALEEAAKEADKWWGQDLLAAAIRALKGDK